MAQAKKQYLKIDKQTRQWLQQTPVLANKYKQSSFEKHSSGKIEQWKIHTVTEQDGLNSSQSQNL